MDFIQIITDQARLHPAMESQDLAKLCFQAAFGGEHLLADVEAAKKYFDEEFKLVQPNPSLLYEQISPDIYRVNLAAWKNAGIPQEWLFNLFLFTIEEGMASNAQSLFQEYLTIAENAIKLGVFTFSLTDWMNFKTDYFAQGVRPLRHSDNYRINEKPAYRLVNTKLVRLITLLQRLAPLDTNSDRAHIIAIDGRSASGKTTIAKQLEKIIGAGIIHMDDFFLPQVLRSKERLAEPGGNVHYERFMAEVIPSLASKQEFSYQKFDCSIMELNEHQIVRKSPWRVVEGAYSSHPKFNNYMTLKVFSDINSADQVERINKRESKKSAEMYFSRWIPMEENYLKTYAIKEQADIVL